MNHKILYNQDIRDYHQSEGISKSGLDLIAKAPIHYFDKYLADDKEPMDSRALKIGRLAHLLLLQPELLDMEYNILPCEKQAKLDSVEWQEYIKTPQFNTNEWKVTEKLAVYLGNENDKRERLHVDDFIEVRKMINTLKADPQINELLIDGTPEVSFYEQDGEFTKRCRADYLRNDGIIIDYKTVAGGFFSDGRAESFQRIAVKLGYHKAAAWYSDIIAKLTEKPAEGFIFIVQEKVRPYAFGIYILDEDFIEAGRKAIAKDYELYKKCITNNEWPSYTQGIVQIAKPEWI